MTGIFHIGLPPGEFPVFGQRFAKGRYENLWESVEIEFGSGEAARVERLGDLQIERSRLLIGDGAALDGWTEGRSLDGQADVVFWGADGEKLASLSGAKLEYGRYWIRGLPLEKARAVEKKLIAQVQNEGLRVVGELREHDHHALLLDQTDLGNGPGVITLNHAKVFGLTFENGDGAYPVFRELGADGAVLRIRIVLGTDDMKRRYDIVNGHGSSTAS